MLIFGHTGLSAGIVHAIDPGADLRKVALVALLPDLIDKSLALAAPGFANGWSRLVAHGFTGLAAFAAVAVAVSGKRAWPLVLVFALHLACDRTWQATERRVLLWPFLGFVYPTHPIPYADRWWAKLEDPWFIGGELAGLAVLAILWRRGRLSDREKRRAFLRTGVIVVEPAGTP